MEIKICKSTIAADVGRLLEVMGVDRVIAVDLERPGTGSGGAFLGPGIPVETLLTTNIFAEHIAQNILGKDKSHQRGVTVISVSQGRVMFLPFTEGVYVLPEYSTVLYSTVALKL